MPSNPANAVTDKTLSNSFISETIQICAVTRDYRRTIEGYVRLGIGPWAVYDFAPPLLTEATFRGKPAHYSMKLALAWTGNMLWEVIQPLEGPSIYTEFLENHGEGIQHVAVACGDLSLAQQTEEFKKRGFTKIQSGVFNGNVPYAYFDCEDATGTMFEIFDIPEEGLPEPGEWIPGPPQE